MRLGAQLFIVTPFSLKMDVTGLRNLPVQEPREIRFLSANRNAIGFVSPIYRDGRKNYHIAMF